MEQRFNVGDVVRLKYQPNCKLFILEVLKQKCYADVEQVWYDGRVFWSKRNDYLGNGIETKMSRFSDCEVEAIEKYKEPNVVIELRKELEKTTGEKIKAISEQDFEKAAKIREEERELKRKISLFDSE